MMPTVLTYMISALSISMFVLAGRKNYLTWIVGLVIQMLWIVYIFQTQSWGLAPMVLFCIVIFTINHFKWYKDDIQTTLDKTMWASVKCKFGCKDPVVAVVYMPEGCLCWRDPVQALCLHHLHRAQTNGPSTVLVDLREG
jgi:hypothetical protein